LLLWPERPTNSASRSSRGRNSDPAIAQEVGMHDIKERLSLFWLFALLNYLYADVIALFAFCWLAEHSPTPPAMGSAGVGGLDGNTHRHDSGVSTASV